MKSVEDWYSMRSRLERHDEYGGRQARFGLHVISCDIISREVIWLCLLIHCQAQVIQPCGSVASGNYAVPLPYGRTVE